MSTTTPENNNRLNFLDLTIIRNTPHLEIDVFCKPTTTDTTINYLSNHPQEHKLAAYRFLINRMHNLPLYKNRRKHEWQTILQIAKNNHFPTALIHNLKHRMTQKRKQPLLPFPPTTHTTHKERKMGHIHLLIPTNQKRHQPTQKNQNRNSLQMQ